MTQPILTVFVRLPGLPEGLEQVFRNVHNRLKKDLNEPQNQAGLSIGNAINSVASEQLERSKAKQKKQ